VDCLAQTILRARRRSGLHIRNWRAARSCSFHSRVPARQPCRRSPAGFARLLTHRPASRKPSWRGLPFSLESTLFPLAGALHHFAKFATLASQNSSPMCGGFGFGRVFLPVSYTTQKVAVVSSSGETPRQDGKARTACNSRPVLFATKELRRSATGERGGP
jgi:hypothetical protein